MATQHDDGLSPVATTAPVYWRGELYGKNLLAARILILGESHIGDNEITDAQSTNRTIRSRIDAHEHGSFFSVVEQILLGRPPLIFERSRLWESVAFANYAPLQVKRGDNAGLRHFARARARFAEMVGELQPDLVCFFSKKAWENRPVARESSWHDAFGSSPVELNANSTIYPYRDRKLLAVRLNHPRGLMATMAEWHLTFAKALTEATQLKFDKAPIQVDLSGGLPIMNIEL